jgi:transposase-like protein
MTNPLPPECPHCGCHWAPLSGHKQLKDRLILKHKCKNCGKEFTRKVDLVDAKLYGVPDLDLKG